MSSLETTRSKLEAIREALLTVSELSVNRALARMSEIVEQAGDDALALEREERFEEAATLYEMVAGAFEIAARKVPEEDRQRIASLGDYWSLKAWRARLAPEPTAEPTPQPSPYTEQRRAPITDRLSLKMQRQQGFTPATDRPTPSAKVRPQQAMDLKRLDEVQAGRGTEFPTPPRPKRLERETEKRRQISHKKPRLDRDLENLLASETSEKGA